MTLPRPEDLHSTAQAAEVLQVPPALITRWKRDGKAMPAGMLRAPVPGGLEPQWYLAELRPLVEAYQALQRRRSTRRKPSVVDSV